MKLEDYSQKYIHYYAEDIPELIRNTFDNYKIRNLADLGCGDGSILCALFRKGYLDKVETVIAVDISKERIDNARSISDKITGIVCDVCDLKMLKASSLDLIISSQVIEHLPDEEKFLGEAYRILSEGGLFYLATVFRKRFAWYFYRCNGKWVLDPTHLREYTATEQLLNIIRKFNFEILEDKKTLHWFPLTDFVFKRIYRDRDIYRYGAMKFLRKIKIPILGYYNWELILKKRNN